MLFVGLGGTGCLVGTELERRLREEICGPDGMAFANHFEDRRHRAFELPSCLQFVYADFSESQLNRLAYRQAEGPLRAAYSQTARAQRVLPNVTSSPELMRSLREAFPPGSIAWLPPRANEPHIAPLADGAAQLPTVGRACLFETFRHGLDPAIKILREAASKIERSAEDVAALGGKLWSRSCDVFVAFSVAGGTGAGIFYDYLHLIAKAFDEVYLPVKIYPLVLMPSAFGEHAGGGRPADLNAAGALVDLFRLVDDQNAPALTDDLNDEVVEVGSTVLYPTGSVQMRPGTTETAFLFSRTAGIKHEDLHRSMASTVVAMIDTASGDRHRDPWDTDGSQSFADHFANAGVRRSDLSASGIGRRGVSTALAASLTVPKEQLADLLASRLLAQGVLLQEARARRETERYRDHVVRFFAISGLGPLWSRRSVPINEGAPAHWAPAIVQALAARANAIDDALDDLDRQLTTTVAQLARDFNPNAAASELLTSEDAHLDVFQLYSVVAGCPDAEDPVVRGGFGGMVRSLRHEPELPAGVQVARPQPRQIKDRLPKVIPARWWDPDVRASLDEQDRWHEWQAKVRWHQHWNRHATVWRRPLETFESQVLELHKAFIEFCFVEKESFGQRLRQLYRPRAAVSYMLPPQTDLEAFYAAAMRRLVQAEDLGDNDDAGHLLRALVPAELWERVYHVSAQHDPQIAVNLVKDHLKFRILDLFTASDGGSERPFLPSLGELLVATASGKRSTLDEKTLAGFREKLGMLPPLGSVPEGSGTLRTVVAYPATKDDAAARRFLQMNLALPHDGSIEFVASSSESISVSMYRSNMGLADVPEIRKVLRTYTNAVKENQSGDHLMWRQRLGWRQDWSISTAEEQQHIMQRLLCAMWNGEITVRGSEESPTQIRVVLRGDDAAAMVLDLDWYDAAVSSWGSILRAYETWTLLDNDALRQAVSTRLLATIPSGMDSPPQPPSDLFIRFVEHIAPAQRRLLEDPDLAEEEWAQSLRTFWTKIVEGALDLRIKRASRTARTSLRRLYASLTESGNVTLLDAFPVVRNIGAGSGYRALASGSFAEVLVYGNDDREVLWPRIRPTERQLLRQGLVVARHLVDIDQHRSSFSAQLPTLDENESFTAEIDILWHVVDPLRVIDSELVDVTAALAPDLVDGLRGIARTHRSGSQARAEVEANLWLRSAQARALGEVRGLDVQFLVRIDRSTGTAQEPAALGDIPQGAMTVAQSVAEISDAMNELETRQAQSLDYLARLINRRLVEQYQFVTPPEPQLSQRTHPPDDPPDACVVRLAIDNDRELTVGIPAQITLWLEPGRDHPWALAGADRPAIEVVSTPLSVADIEPARVVYEHLDAAQLTFVAHESGPHRVRFTMYLAATGTALQEVETDFTVNASDVDEPLSVPGSDPVGRS